MNLEQRQKIRNSGLEIVAEGGTPGSLDPVKAWKMSINLDSKPVAIISDDKSDAAALVDRAWQGAAKDHGLFSGDGTFLLSIPGDPFHSTRWYRVRIRGAVKMAEFFVDGNGYPEFVTASVDGYPVVGVSSEEDGTWILAFDGPDR
ncbi:hypothetical protein [Rhodococcus sp. W8901]|uniref:hypothetical protein n=1 Tax=Rhodococcus sp. W8901 TaxID=2742603 RepID=UPI0015825632|nr:hypothetical protein [Rhodococcus sp. W8901]QKT11310.1 hypothetical protein HUN07_11725 [Rhodococcus sp. W8901]